MDVTDIQVSQTGTTVTFTGVKLTSGRGKVQVTAISDTPNCVNKNSYIYSGVTNLETSGDGSTVVVDGLTPGCPYTITLKAACEKTANGQTTVVTSDGLHTHTTCTAPEAIDEAVLVNAGLTSVSISSVTLANSGSYVDLLVSATETCSSDTAVTAVDGQSVPSVPRILTDLLSGCLYTFSIAPRCSSDSGNTYTTGASVSKKMCTSEKFKC